MQLSLQTDYALRILMALAVSEPLLGVDDIARRYGISRNHLAKVAARLQEEGFIESFRGRGGGMRLARAPEAINVGDVVRRLENLDSFVSCFSTQSSCRIDGACGLKPVLARALDGFLQQLDQSTLKDIVPDRQAFGRTLERLAAERN